MDPSRQRLARRERSRLRHRRTPMTVRVDVHLTAVDLHDALTNDVRRGLTASPKDAPPKWFYDDLGSQLFDEITRLDEYYPTRAERGLLERSASEIVERTTPRALAELGAGTATKSRVLLREITRHASAQYLPLDVDGDTLELTAAALRTEFSSLDV